MLIDLDRCQRSTRPVQFPSPYQPSDMHTPHVVHSRRGSWKNYNLDWKAVGLVICFVLDQGVQAKDYHCMISNNKVTNGVNLDPFVKCLLEEGRWDDDKWTDFRASSWLRD